MNEPSPEPRPALHYFADADHFIDVRTVVRGISFIGLVLAPSSIIASLWRGIESVLFVISVFGCSLLLAASIKGLKGPTAFVRRAMLAYAYITIFLEAAVLLRYFPVFEIGLHTMFSAPKAIAFPVFLVIFFHSKPVVGACR